MKTTNDVEKICHSIFDTSHIIGISRSSIYKAINKGQIKVLKCGRRTLVPASECEAFLNRLAQENGK